MVVIGSELDDESGDEMEVDSDSDSEEHFDPKYVDIPQGLNSFLPTVAFSY